MVQDQTNVVVIVGSMHANVEGIYNVLNNSGMDILLSLVLCPEAVIFMFVP